MDAERGAQRHAVSPAPLYRTRVVSASHTDWALKGSCGPGVAYGAMIIACGQMLAAAGQTFARRKTDAPLLSAT
jgi:hypothetical protein